MSSEGCPDKRDRSTPEVVDLLTDDESEDKATSMVPSADKSQPTALVVNPYIRKRQSVKKAEKTKRQKSVKSKSASLQVGLVLDEDGDYAYSAAEGRCNARLNGDFDLVPQITVAAFVKEQHERRSRGLPVELYHDKDFTATPASIEGAHVSDRGPPKCRCKLVCPLRHKTQGPNKNRAYYSCARRSCDFFRWALTAQQMQWYRFGPHTNHRLVDPVRGFSAQDLLQGKVGDCWFLSALAVIAERPDLIQRLFRAEANGISELNSFGIFQVNLFIDGYWRSVVMDDFLPCLIDSATESDLQAALAASLSTVQPATSSFLQVKNSSSLHDCFAISDDCRKVLDETNEYLAYQRSKESQAILDFQPIKPLQRIVSSDDLAYSKARNQQLWVPFLEKAYAKSHGSYHAISGGHIAEAFLDLTGAPTKQFLLFGPGFNPREFWHKLMTWRSQRLPMGCGTDRSAVGIIGMHAYSILDVREIRNVDVRFFAQDFLQGTHGNVSGFQELGTVRLLKIRNPHGKGEWKGDFSDGSRRWEELLNSIQSDQGRSDLAGIERSMKNDGTFWIDYDSFLMGFSNVDVVFAFQGNHARSFTSSFPAKVSNHRCAKAFEVSLLDPQPGLSDRDSVELYVMGIQKSRRGAAHGRSDRRKSYKVSDLGILVGEHVFSMQSSEGLTERDRSGIFSSVRGAMFGFQRCGSFRLPLDRSRNKRLIVMPISFGHPAASAEDLSFVLRFVADAPLMIKELPFVPRMDFVVSKYCMQSVARSNMDQHSARVLLERSDPSFSVFLVDCRGGGGNTVFIYLAMDDDSCLNRGISVSVEINCRGMTCRTAHGLLKHETIAKGKKFEASWRRYTCSFVSEKRSRLLMVAFQSGQDTELGGVSCELMSIKTSDAQTPFFAPANSHTATEYDKLGIFNKVHCSAEEYAEISRKSSIFGNHVSVDLEEAMEASRREYADSTETDDDEQLRLALEMSLAEANTSQGHAVPSIQASQASKDRVKRPADRVLVDLTNE